MAVALAEKLVFQLVSLLEALLLLAVLLELAGARAMLPALVDACMEVEAGAIGQSVEARSSARAVV